jgi:cytochrome c
MTRIRKLSLALAVCLGAATSTALALDGHAIALKNSCLACHAVDQKLVGPSFKSVAEKYKGNSQAEKTLMAKVKSGGQGVWGSMPMPAQSQLNNDDLKSVVDWILAQ